MSTTKERARVSRRKWYYNNRQHAIDKVNERRKERIEWFKDFKQTLKCERCGESDFRCLDFHHRNPNEKDSTVSNMGSRGAYSQERVLKEIEKCVVLCANCHRKLHYKGEPRVDVD